MSENNVSTMILSQDGPLSLLIPNFQSRVDQQQMAKIIEETLASSQKLIIEAGTGTGKTFAYLVPAFLSNQKIILSTGTKNLQAQLFEKDIPLIKKALNSTKKVVLLKGRSNYLCLYRLEKSLHSGFFSSKQAVYDLARVEEWSTMTRTGDIAEIDRIQEDALIWPHVTSHHENCLGADCPFVEKCYVMRARRKAQQADIVVVNHHLFLADLTLKGKGIDDLLPGANSVIFDEAHQLPETATNFFGEMVSSHQIIELASDIRREYLLSAKDVQILETIFEKLKMMVQDCRLAFGEGSHRNTWDEISGNTILSTALDDLTTQLDEISLQLGEVATRSKGLENCWTRSLELATQLKELLKTSAKENTIRWFETFSKSFILRKTPLDISDIFKESMQCYTGAWIFTSATLSVADHFTYFAENLGLLNAKTLKLDSPFNYEKQVMPYVPLRLSHPNTPEYTRTIVENIIPVLKASRGRAFFLFTSFRALNEAHTLLLDRIEYPLLVQGSKPKYTLLNEFRKQCNAVLLGTHSFWEGVDVRGEALSCVIIDRLPFTSPDEPILKARVEQLRKQGKDPFNEYQLPHAVVSLKQGVGRLIRDEHDTGILVICDPRLFSRSYGKVFLNSLPKMRYTRCLSDVEKFFNLNEKS